MRKQVEVKVQVKGRIETVRCSKFQVLGAANCLLLTADNAFLSVLCVFARLPVSSYFEPQTLYLNLNLNLSLNLNLTPMSVEPTPTISVIIPVHNGAAYLNSCLQAVAASDYSPYECIVVNDGSTDDSEKIAGQFSARVLNLSGGPFGPAYARNRGVEVARADIVFFLDADIVLAPGALRRVQNLFQERTDVAAVFGSYDARPAARGVISQYRNLLHHFVHQNGNREASTFWAGCGAIRRSVFQKVGGFDDKRFSRPSIEDIELGYRLRQSGYRILLDKGLQGTHLKSWNLYSLIQTDISCRALPWSRLILETKKLPNDLNLRLGQRVSFALVALACAFLALAVLQPRWLIVSASALLGVVALNRKLYLTFFRQRGIFFTAACIPLHILYYLYSGLTYLYAWTEFQLRKVARRRSSRFEVLGSKFKSVERRTSNIERF
jgi:glycosyltransferase involved in cell wall biosynthesis